MNSSERAHYWQQHIEHWRDTGLIETAKANDLEPSAYIRHVLERIADADTLEKLERLLPWNVELKRTSKKVAQYS